MDYRHALSVEDTGGRVVLPLPDADVRVTLVHLIAVYVVSYLLLCHSQIGNSHAVVKRG